MSEEVVIRIVGEDGLTRPAQNASRSLEGLNQAANRAHAGLRSATGSTSSLGGAYARLGGYIGDSGLKLRVFTSAMHEAQLGSGVLLASLTGLAAAFGAFLVKSAMMAAGMEQTQIGMEGVTGSAEEAQKQIAELWDFAAKTPFQFRDLLQQTRRLQALGFAAEDVLPMLQAVGNQAAKMGQTSFEMERIIRTLGQIKMKGKVSSEEITQQLGESLVPGWRFIAEDLGVTIAKAQEMGEKGLLDVSRTITAIIRGMERESKDAMKRQAESIIGIWSTLKDNIEMIMVPIGDAILSVFGVKGAMKQINEWLGAFTNAFREYEKAATAAGRVGQGVRDMFADLFPPNVINTMIIAAGAIAGALTPALFALGTTIALTLAHLLPFIAAGGALAFAAMTIYRNWDSLQKLMQNPIVQNTLFIVAAAIAGALIPSLERLAVTITTRVVTAIWGLVAAIAGAIVPILPFAAVAALIAFAWINNWGNIQTHVKNALDNLATWISETGPKLVAMMFETGKSMAVNFLDGVINMVTGAIDMYVRFTLFIEDWGPRLLSIFDDIWNSISALWNAYLTTIIEANVKFWAWVATNYWAYLQNLYGMLRDGLNNALVYWEQFLNSMGTSSEQAWNKVIDIFSGGTKWIVQQMMKLKDALPAEAKLALGAWNLIPSDWEKGFDDFIKGAKRFAGVRVEMLNDDKIISQQATDDTLRFLDEQRRAYEYNNRYLAAMKFAQPLLDALKNVRDGIKGTTLEDITDKLRGLGDEIKKIGSDITSGFEMPAFGEFIQKWMPEAKDVKDYMSSWGGIADEAVAGMGKEAGKAAESAQKAAEKAAEAQLKYALKVADSTEKLRILKDELAKVPEGSAEYYEILSQIAEAEKDIAEETERMTAALRSAQVAGVSVAQAMIMMHPAALAVAAAVARIKIEIDMVNLAIIANTDQLRAAQAQYSAMQGALENTRRQLTEAQNVLDGMRERLSNLNGELSKVRQRLSDLSTPKLKGMGDMENQIAAVQTQLKRLDLAQSLGVPLDEIVRRYPVLTKGMEGWLATLPKGKDALQKILEQLQLSKDLRFDEQLRLIQEAAKAATEGVKPEMTFEQVMKQIKESAVEYDSLTKQIKDQEAAMRSQESVIKSLTDSIRNQEEALRQQAQVIAQIQAIGEALNATLAQYQKELSLAEDKQKAVNDALSIAYQWFMNDRQKLVELGAEAATQAEVIDEKTEALLAMITSYATDTNATAVDSINNMLAAYKQDVANILIELNKLDKTVTTYHDIVTRYSEEGTPPVTKGTGSVPVVSEQQGGSGVVTKPTLFLAGVKAPEAFWFGGEGNTSRPPADLSMTGTPATVSIDIDRLAEIIDQRPVILRIDGEDLVVRGWERAHRRGRL